MEASLGDLKKGGGILYLSKSSSSMVLEEIIGALWTTVVKTFGAVAGSAGGEDVVEG